MSFSISIENFFDLVKLFVFYGHLKLAKTRFLMYLVRHYEESGRAHFVEIIHACMQQPLAFSKT